MVSTDRVIRKAARRRRCRISLSEQFAEALLDGARRASQPPALGEPPEKRAGLTEEQSQEWLREFQIDDQAADDADGSETGRRQ